VNSEKLTVAFLEADRLLVPRSAFLCYVIKGFIRVALLNNEVATLALKEAVAVAGKCSYISLAIAAPQVAWVENNGHWGGENHSCGGMMRLLAGNAQMKPIRNEV
jgi:hypothetical protein